MTCTCPKIKMRWPTRITEDGLLVGKRALRWLSLAVLASVGLTAGIVSGLVAGKTQLGPIDLSESKDLSTVVLDRNAKLLRAFTTQEGRWRLPVTVNDVDPRYLSLLFAFEDRRFYAHSGVDARAVLRAVLQTLKHGRLISGASTLTMQAARLVERRHERSLARKLRQVVRALQLEGRLSKREILDLYLRLAPFGGNIEGARAATLAYFGKEPKHLSLGQAALLVALPQSPESRRPDRHPTRAKRARNRVLDVALKAGVITKAEADRAKLEPVPTKRKAFPMLAPHLAEQEVARFGSRQLHKTTLLRDKQQALQRLLREQTRLMGDKLSSALLAIENKTGNVVAYVGASDYLNSARKGSIDMVQAVRSPGSTLKPIIYGLGFEVGLAHPETLIEDRRVQFGNYSPENFDNRFHGAVSIREALGQSLNIPAVKMLNEVGPVKFVERLTAFDVMTKLPDRAKPSLAVALGGIGMRMVDLVSVYSALARGGRPAVINWRRPYKVATAKTKNADKKNARSVKKSHLLSPIASWYVTDILRDAPVPKNVKAGRIAYKTGTSYGYRDAWAVGYDGDYTIAVWVGRPDATSTPGLIGRTAAAPILFDAFARLRAKAAPLQKRPSGALHVTGADLPPPLKRFRSDQAVQAQGPFDVQAVEISFPPDRSELDVAERAGEPLVLKARGGTLPLTWLVDGKPIESPAHRRTAFWTPDGNGFVNLSVVDADGEAARVHVRLK